ncbi:MAG: thiamine pyrophosphate-dependent enzyme [Methyloligellaceae bacterium]
MPLMTTGDAISQSLIRHGVDTVFGIPGAHMYDFNDALARSSEKIKFITTRHEQGAGYMAFGYAKSTGKTGVYTVVPGPGVLNSSAALATAYGANTPVVCITGNIMSHLIGKGRGQLHELPDQLATLRGFTGWSERINHPSEAPYLVAEAFRQMLAGRIRPVALEAPWDVFGQKGEVSLDVNRDIPPPPVPDQDAVKQAAKLIKQAKNPLILVGAGAFDAAEEINELAQMIQTPVTAHRSGKGVVSNELPHGLLSSEALEYWPKCDLVIGIGSRLELIHFRWNWIPDGLKTIRIDIDPTEFVRLKPDIGIVTDAQIGTAALLEELSSSLDKIESRTDELNEIKAVARKKIKEVQPQFDYLQAIRTALPPDGFFVEEITQVGFTARFAFPVYAPRQYVTCGYQDNLGFGFHTGLGVKVANPDKCVVSISGDGGFLFGVQELATAVQHNINLVAVVFNNQAFGNVRRDQNTVYDGRLLGADLSNPDFVKLAESFGAKGVRVATPTELKQEITAAFMESGPVLIEVPLERGSESSPWPFIHPDLPAR